VQYSLDQNTLQLSESIKLQTDARQILRPAQGNTHVSVQKRMITTTLQVYDGLKLEISGMKPMPEERYQCHGVQLDQDDEFQPH